MIFIQDVLSCFTPMCQTQPPNEEKAMMKLTVLSYIISLRINSGSLLTCLFVRGFTGWKDPGEYGEHFVDVFKGIPHGPTECSM